MPRTGRLRARLTGGLLALVAVLGSTAVIGASPADAQPVDRCGSAGTEWVPDSGAGFDFNEACRLHDHCYGIKPHGAGSSGRLACDREFLNHMRFSCAAIHGPMVGSSPCLTLADLYYLGVRVGGTTPFEEAEVPTGHVEVGPVEPIRDEPPASSGGGGGGYGGGGGGGWIGGGFGGGGGGTPTGTVTVGEPETVATQAE
ncbi:phospholipase A2 [Actinomarinicola tropica]|uniref:Phospholipase n=1 Tax=Actinomarinicola tropica TaxID=2789776 RepID=A0A5Q2RBG4_9ACTN|nr:phospholipase A2 [Actinomarinicola tropica]QGG94209.1 hypothetical protein GH723_03330 [Actinomarinicola tropica]